MKKHIVVKYRILVLTIEVIIFLLFVFLAYNYVSVPAKKTTFYLSDSKSSTLLKTLSKHGYNIYTLDKYVLKFMKTPKKGWYSLKNKRQGRFTFFKSLHTRQTKTMNIKLYAGETSEELTKRLANDMKLDPIRLLNAYKSHSQYKESDLFSGRYTVARNADENTTIAYLSECSNKIFRHFSHTYTHKKHSELEKKVLLIIASIIQKESNSIDEMPLISSVIYNRLEKGMKLQMDGTLNYGKFAHIIVTPERIKNDNSLYNTYKHKGLPPAPLGTVSIEALRAAYSPKASEYLFFMLNKDGSHNFASTYENHIKNIRAFKSKSKDDTYTKKIKPSL